MTDQHMMKEVVIQAIATTDSNEKMTDRLTAKKEILTTKDHSQTQTENHTITTATTTDAPTPVRRKDLTETAATTTGAMIRDRNANRG